MESLSKEDKSKVLVEESIKPSWFGDGEQFVSSIAAIIPAHIDQHRVSIRTNNIDSDIPLLLKTDTIGFLGDEIPFNTTSNGLYAIPIPAAKQLLQKTDSQSPHHHNVLRTREEKSTREIATKLQRSFANPSIDKLLALTTQANSGQKMTTEKEISEMSQKIAQSAKSIKSPHRIQ